MPDKNRFRRRRQLLRERGLCERCGVEAAQPGLHIGKECAAEMRIKKIVRPTVFYRCEKIGRLERNLAIFEEAARACRRKLDDLRAG